MFVEFKAFQVLSVSCYYLSSVDLSSFLLFYLQTVAITAIVSHMLADIMISSILVWFL